MTQSASPFNAHMSRLHKHRGDTAAARAGIQRAAAEIAAEHYAKTPPAPAQDDATVPPTEDATETVPEAQQAPQDHPGAI